MTINVVYSSSDAYAQCTGISVLSLFENNKDIDELNLYIIDTDISYENKEKIGSIAKLYNRNVKFIPAKEQFNKNAEKLKLSILRGAYNTYARLILNTWFEDLDRILVIDSDTLIVGSILEFWRMDLKGGLIGAVPEVGVYLPENSYEDINISNLNDYYFNMGIALYDLKRWREENIDDYIANKIQQYNKEFVAAEQSMLNYCIGDRMRKADLKYNFYTLVHGINYKTVNKLFSGKKLFSEEEFNSAKKNPTIIHFVGFPFERPWYINCASPYIRTYQEYRDKSPWAGMPLTNPPRPKSKIFGVYDYITWLLKKLNMYSFALWFRCIVGQRIKKIIKQKR
jgi:lipopolysaccharide biosynthesis glycosyltransferase